MERIPLLNKQKEEAYQLWCDIHQEDLFHRKRLLKEYCHTNDCDIVLAIDYIISQIKDKVFLFYNSKASYVSDKDNGETCTTDLENLLYSEFAKEGIVNYYEEYTKQNNHYTLNSKFSNVQLISEKIVKEDIELLNDWKEEKLETEKKTVLIPNVIINSEENPLSINNDIDKFNYKLMHDLLYSYIPNGTEPIYKSIVERHVLPKDAQSLKMKKNIKANIIRFADCFGISISEINQIFDIKVDSNNRPKEYINDFFRVLKQINPDFTK